MNKIKKGIKQKRFGNVCTYEEYTNPKNSKPTWGMNHEPEEYRAFFPQLDLSSENSYTVIMLKEAPIKIQTEPKGDSFNYEFWCESEGKTCRFLTTNPSLLAELSRQDWGATLLRGKTLKIVRTGKTYQVTDLTKYIVPSGKNSSQDKKYWKPEGV